MTIGISRIRATSYTCTTAILPPTSASAFARTGVIGGASAVERLSGSYNASKLFPVHTQRMYKMDANRSGTMYSAQCGYSLQKWPPLVVRRTLLCTEQYQTS